MERPDVPDLSLAPNKTISSNGPVFIIAEVGQNHQGDMDIAKRLIHIAKESGADCVKFQKSCLPSKFNSLALHRPYTSPHSWGETYGAHKAHLEFRPDQFQQLQHFAEKEVGITFTASAMDEDSVDVLDKLNVPFIKIGSGDNCNWPLLYRAANTGRPLVVSTGMMDLDDVHALHQKLTQWGAKFALLHCVSAYPAAPDQLNLRVIPEFQRLFPQTHIGYSGHELGNYLSVGAVALGAKILERHITIDKRWKGTDHACSLEPQEFAELVRAVRDMETALGQLAKRRQPSENACWLKLGKSLVAARNLHPGHVLTEEDVLIKVAEPMGVPCNRLHRVIGQRLSRPKQCDQSIMPEDLANCDNQGCEGCA